MTNYINLHNKTHFSILNALPSPEEYLSRAKELNQNSLAITDVGTLAGAWDALKASKELKIKLIIGCEFYFVDNFEKKDAKLRSIVLLAKNLTGYKNILTLNRLGFDNSHLVLKKVISVIDWELLKNYSSDMACLTGCANGIVGKLLNEKRFDEAKETLLKLYNIFGNSLGVEVQAHNLNRNGLNQQFTNYHLIRLANENNLKIVPTSFSHYIKKEDAAAHDTLLAIKSMQPVYSNARLKYDVQDLYLKSGDEIKTFFTRGRSEEFAEKICENTIYFAEMCENAEFIDPKYTNPTGKELPEFPVKNEKGYDEFKFWLEKQEDNIKLLEEDKAYLRFVCYREFEKLETKLPKDKIKEYEDRLNEELEILEHQGFSSYMLIVYDYIKWAIENDIAVGPGRGSVGGSFVAYLLNIHKADPIQYNLIFARFQNKEKTAYPDVDQDVATSGRNRVIDFLFNKYGFDNVASISNFNHMTPKVFARDIARSCDLSNDRKSSVAIGNTIADSIPADYKNLLSFDELIEKAPLFADYTNKYKQYKDYKSLLGLYRNFSTHAAAIVISKRKLLGLVPLRKDKEGSVCIEYEKNNTEANGLLKMDILGLSTLDLITETLKLIKAANKPLPTEHINYDLYDKKTYDLISKGDTFGVFQFGTSAGTIDLCKKIQPKNIEDLAIITTLARPAAKNIREAFIETRSGKRSFKLLHPSLKNAFEKTFGFGLFDESILQLAQDVAGWSLHSADRIRKMIKDKGKNPEKIIALRSEFIEDAIKFNSLDRQMAIRIWDEEINKFQSYTFNKSHAVMYSFTSYTTAYLKAHYPIEFLLANLMAEIRSSAKVADQNIDKIKQELKSNGVKIIPPDINKSQLSYQINEDLSLLTGFTALKFVGDDAIADIIQKRPFFSFDDFMLRIDTSKVRSNTIKALAAGGCLDSFGINRKLIFFYCEDYRKKLQVWLKKHDPKIEKFPYNFPDEKDWDLPELYALEKYYLGESFVCGKKQAYKGFFKKGSIPFITIKGMDNREYISSVRAEIKNIFEFSVKKEASKFLGQKMLKATLEDEFGEMISLTIFPDKWKIVKDRMKELSENKVKFDVGIAVHFSGTVNLYEDEIGIIIDNLFEFAAQPSLPKDLKAKKTSTKNKEIEKKLETIDILDNTEEYIASIEDSLFDEGTIDLENDNEFE